ncbi:MAG TPA: hypothetical protein VMU51_04300 [Mycobacteriales bacterium]|nr:hypothetical protein [Mycobacteriales bacterium]
MTGIFVNYRSADSGWAVLLDRELSARFGPDSDRYDIGRLVTEITEYLPNNTQRHRLSLPVAPASPPCRLHPIP